MSDRIQRPEIKKTYGKQKDTSVEDAIIQPRVHHRKNGCIFNDLTSLQENRENIPEQFQNIKKRAAPTIANEYLAADMKRQKKNTSGKVSQKYIAEFFKPTFAIPNENEDSDNYMKRKGKNSTIPRFDSGNRVTPSTTIETKRRVKEYEQLFLDLGQKSFNTCTCTDCNMSYNRGTIDDEALHAKYHQAIVGGISYKNEILLQLYPEINGGRVIMLKFNQSNPFEKRKIRQILDVINTELCAVELSEERLDKCKIYLYVTDKKRVMGCVVAEPISQAYRVVESGNMLLQIGTSSD
ncbi:4926_t:CDS:2, partial [Acaulospora colombiana]